jgi:CRISPR-associated protein (TIGR03986 family)
MLEFGLTRFFKIAHKYSIGDVLDRESVHKLPDPMDFTPDMVEALFGYVLEKSDFKPDSAQSEARKGRVAFGFAKLVNAEDATEGPVIETIMGAPRASFAPFYLRGRYKDYSDLDTRLAGRKRYIPRFRREDLADAPQNLVKSLKHQIERLNRDPASLRDVISRLSFLQHRTKGGELLFRSEIRLHNVSAVELGLLLWVLTHGGDPSKPYRHQIGRGKPFGAGQTRVENLRLALRPNDAAAQARLIAIDPQGGEGWTRDGLDPKPFLRAFEAYMAKNWSGWPKVTSVEQWLNAAKPAYGAAEASRGRFEYPALPEFNTIRKAVKLDTKQAVPANAIPDSLLAVTGKPTTSP